MEWLKYENEALEKGYTNICGVDEAGRGPLAGPVCAAAVILPKGHIIDGVNDSKKLTEKKREKLFDVIIDECVSYSIAFATVEEIEELNILNATAECIVKGDANSMSIAAASILAKVARDRLCLKYDELYPEYGFAKHKGYGTKLHREMILKYGPCEIHRKSFLKKIYKNANN